MWAEPLTLRDVFDANRLLDDDDGDEDDAEARKYGQNTWKQTEARKKGWFFVIKSNERFLEKKMWGKIERTRVRASEAHEETRKEQPGTMSEQIKWGNFCESVQAWTNEAGTWHRMKNYMRKYIEMLGKNNRSRIKEWAKKNNGTEKKKTVEEEEEDIQFDYIIWKANLQSVIKQHDALFRAKWRSPPHSHLSFGEKINNSKIIEDLLTQVLWAFVFFFSRKKIIIEFATTMKKPAEIPSKKNNVNLLNEYSPHQEKKKWRKKQRIIISRTRFRPTHFLSALHCTVHSIWMNRTMEFPFRLFFVIRPVQMKIERPSRKTWCSQRQTDEKKKRTVRIWWRIL